MEKRKTNDKLVTSLQLLPIIVFSALVPLIVFVKYVPLDEFTASHWMGTTFSIDVFAFYKMVVIIASAFVALILLIFNLLKKKSKLQLSFVLIVTLAYAILIILSSILSDYSTTSFWGSPERYEGAIVLISYLIMFIYTMTVVDNIKKVQIILSSVIISSAIMGIISALQFLGLNIFEVNFFRNIINLNGTKAHPSTIQILHGNFVSYGTLYNPNNLSVYIALTFPLALTLFAILKSKKAVFLSAIMTYLLTLSLFGASAAGGYYALAISLVLLFILSFKYVRRNIVNIVIFVVVVTGMLLITNIFTDNRIAEKINLLSASSEIARTERESKLIFINNIILGKDEVFIDTTDKDFTVKNSENTISVRDANGITIPVFVYDEGENDTFSGNIIPFEDPEYQQYIITTNDNYSVFAVKAGIRTMYFHMTEDGVKVPGMNNSLDDIQPIERNEFLYKYPNLFSGRGYIWSGMLPLINNTVVLGNGPDTTFLTYPQNDYIGKINMLGIFNIIIEKPHCYYIQVAHDTGWISLLLLLSLFGYYFIDTLLILKNSKKDGLWRVYSISSLCGVIAYLIASIMYDSSVLTAPVFWTILAIGISLNAIGKKTLTLPEDPAPQPIEIKETD